MLKFLRYPIIPGLLLSLGSVGLLGQDLDSLLQASLVDKTEYTTATFKATRILNGHSIERMTEGEMDVRISHRFGTINSGAYEFFGLDQAHIHLGVEYGITDWIMVGLGRGTFEKTIDGFTKISLLRQSTGLKKGIYSNIHGNLHKKKLNLSETSPGTTTLFIMT